MIDKLMVTVVQHLLLALCVGGRHLLLAVSCLRLQADFGYVNKYERRK